MYVKLSSGVLFPISRKPMPKDYEAVKTTKGLAYRIRGYWFLINARFAVKQQEQVQIL